MKHLVILALVTFLSSPIFADPYIGIGIGFHDSAMDGPEISLDNELGILEAGYQVNNWDVRFTHMSGLRTRETGYGANILSVNYRWYFR